MSELTPGDRKARFNSWAIVALLIGGIVAINGTYLFFDPNLRNQLATSAYGIVESKPSRGFLERTFWDVDGQSHRYMVFVPHQMKDTDHLPLLVYLNGYGENGDNGLAPLRNGLAHAIWEDEHHFPFVVVWPQCDEGDDWGHASRSTDRALAIMREVAGEFHTDPDRVYLSGISSGGIGTWAIAAEHPDLFAAIIPVSAEMNEKNVQPVATAKIPIWSYSVEDDGADLVRLNRKAHKSLLDAGLSPHLTEVGTKGVEQKDGHDAWSFAYRDGGMYRWLAAQERDNQSPRSQRFDLLDLTKILGPFVPVESVDPIFEAVARIPAESSDKEQVSRSTLSGQGLVEIHLEFRTTNKIKRFGVGFLSPEKSNFDQDSFVDLAIDDLNSGGVYSWPARRCIVPALPVAEHAFYIDGWNDLRLKFSQGRLTVELNGWSLLNNVELVQGKPDSTFGFVTQGESGSYVQVRNLRVRRDESATSSEVDSVRNRSLDNASKSTDGSGSDRIVSLATIAEAWKHREQLHPHVAMTWTIENGSRYAAASFRSQELQPVLSRLTISDRDLQYSTPWQHPRVDLTRKAGLRDATSLQDFNRRFKARFAVPAENLPESLQLIITSDDKSRIDEVSDPDGRGYRGIVYDQPNVWKDRVGEMDDLLWRGPVLALRPLTRSGIGFQPADCVLLPDMAWVAGVRCWVIEETIQLAGEKLKRRFWVDPARDYLILRTTVSVDDMLREQLDIQYTLDSSQQWLPASWDAVTWPRLASSISEFQFAGNEWLFQSVSAKTVECRTDKPLDDAPSVTHFHQGTVVFDQHSKEWFQQVSAGVRRKLNADEASEMAMNGRLANRDSGSWRLYQIVGLGLLLLVGCWAGVRRTRRLR